MTHNVLRFPSPETALTPIWNPIWTGSPCEDGDYIVLAHEVWPQMDSEAYIILYSSPDNQLEVIQRFPFAPEFEGLAKFAAEIADKTLGTVVYMQPPANGGLDDAG